MVVDDDEDDAAVVVPKQSTREEQHVREASQAVQSREKSRMRAAQRLLLIFEMKELVITSKADAALVLFCIITISIIII